MRPDRVAATIATLVLVATSSLAATYRLIKDDGHAAHVGYVGDVFLDSPRLLFRFLDIRSLFSALGWVHLALYIGWSVHRIRDASLLIFALRLSYDNTMFGKAAIVNALVSAVSAGKTSPALRPTFAVLTSIQAQSFGMVALTK
jgi:hypothetical protein